MTRRCMLRSLDTHELRDWAAYERIEPFFADRIDYGFTALNCLIRMALGEKGVVFKDHLPAWHKDAAPQKEQTPEQIGAVFESIRRAMESAKNG